VQEIDNGPLVHERSIRYSTFAAFKGLEADAVVIIDIDDLTSETARGGLYVGASRARVLLALFISEAVRQDYERLAVDFGRRLTEVRSHLGT
jgi:DNA helicase IV